jgi:hypothetical protein
MNDKYSIYKYENEDPKQTTCDLSVTFRFPEGTDLTEAEGYILSQLAEIDKGVEYSFDMWTTPTEDYS